MADINQYSPRTGRELKEDGTFINTAEMIEAIYNALVVNKDAGVVASGIEVASITATDVTIKDPDDGDNKLKINEDGSVNTQLTGSNMELYGASINDRPAANTVPAGATFTIVDRDLDKNWISDGTNWEEV